MSNDQTVKTLLAQLDSLGLDLDLLHHAREAIGSLSDRYARTIELSCVDPNDEINLDYYRGRSSVSISITRHGSIYWVWRVIDGLSAATQYGRSHDCNEVLDRFTLAFQSRQVPPAPDRSVQLGNASYPVRWATRLGQYVACCQPEGFWAEVVGFGDTPDEAVDCLVLEYDRSVHMA